MSVNLCDQNPITIAILVDLTRRNEDYEMIGFDSVMSFALMLVSSLARNNPKKPRTHKSAVRRSLSSESGVAYLATILAKVSIEMGSFLHDVVRGDRLPASKLLRIKGVSAGFDAREQDHEPTLWRIGIVV